MCVYIYIYIYIYICMCEHTHACLHACTQPQNGFTSLQARNRDSTACWSAHMMRLFRRLNPWSSMMSSERKITPRIRILEKCRIYVSMASTQQQSTGTRTHTHTSCGCLEPHLIQRPVRCPRGRTLTSPPEVETRPTRVDANSYSDGRGPNIRPLCA